MENHWSRGAWSADQETYFWYLTFSDEELAEKTEQIQTGLDIGGLDFVPLDGLHITVLKIGNRDGVTAEEIQAIADSAKKKFDELEPFQLEVGPLAGSRGAVRFSVSPWSELVELHRIARAATLEVLPDLEIADTAAFRPHLGIGYSNRHQPAEPLISKISKLRDSSPVRVYVDSVRIVRLRREEHAYRWDDVATIELGV